MVDVARLGLAVDSSQVEKGTVTLHQLTGAAGQAQAAANRLAGATQVEAAGHRAAAAATQAHNAALMAQNTVIRSSMQQRTMMIYQLNDVAVSLASGMNPAMVAMQQGSQILQGGFAPALRTITDLAKGFLVTFWPAAAAVGAVSLAIAGLTYEINKTADVQVGFFDVALAGWQLLAESIGALLTPVWQWIVDSMRWVWDQFAPVLKGIGNDIVGAFVAAYNVVTSGWNNLPTFMGALGKQAWNALLEGLSGDAITFTNPFTGEVHKLLSFDFTGHKANLSQEEQGAWQGTVGNAFSQDWMGDAFGALSGRAQAIALAKTEVEGLGGAAAAANDNVKALANDGFGSATQQVHWFAEAAMSAFSNLGSGIIDAFKKGGGVGMNVLNMLLDKVGQLGENLLNQGLNGLFGGLMGGLFGGGGQWGVAGGFAGFPGIFGIPGMAEGGTVAQGGLSWVGERGPELLRLPTGAQVIPNGPSMAMAANQNGDLIIHNHISVPPGTSPETAPALAREITQEIRRQLPDAIERHNRNPLRRAS